ncbi:PREDICTED: CDP-diacylglycerol--glycerol-3-phosphate 3-phosphatidyltransferase 2-like isoform X2 [Nelumbo nucifera]|nr:PREDICTED: CDP-diacylglycerol--glycerol-3-phosphate 3-phosphatidyltransferase 2-like isoform X2 [Nelumbo nucifera]
MVDRWVRETSYGSTWRAAAAPVAVETMAARTMTSVNLPGNNGERISVGWRLISCAQFGAAPRRGLFRKLGSRGQKAFFFSASFESKVRRPVATGMCSQNKVDRDDMDRSPPLSQNQPLHHIHQPQQLQPSRWLTLPTILTLGRVVAVPLLICTFYMNGWWGTTATTSIFIVAAITDWLDGYIARKMRLGTAFGAFLDPVADKLMVAATLVLLCNRPLGVAVFGDLPWLLTVPSIVIIGREITMSAVREWAASQNNRVLEAVAVNNLGKWKTATQMTALTILLATRDSSLSGSGILVSSGIVLLYVSAGLTIWSLVVYMSKIWRILLK